MQLSKQGAELIKAYETTDGKPHLKAVKSPESNKDGSIKYEIGWGHNSDSFYTVQSDSVITLEQAEQIFKNDTKDAESLANGILKKLCLVRIAQHEYDALVMAIYNGVGLANISTNTHKVLIEYFKNRSVENEQAIKTAWASWNKATVNGVKKVLDGLKLRRLDELELFFKGDYKRNYKRE